MNKKIIAIANKSKSKKVHPDIKIGETRLDPVETAKLLRKVADRIYMDEIPNGLRPLMNQQLGFTRRGMGLDEFRSIYTGDGLKLGFAGPTNPHKIDSSAQKKAVQDIIGGLHQWIDAIVHGATMWAFIGDAHAEAIKHQKLSIGIMPWVGLNDLKIMESCGAFGDDFKKMDYLGISGAEYGDHANLFADSLDVTILLGGRDGALSEALATARRDKPVVSLLMDQNDPVFQTYTDGIWYTKEAGDIVKFTTNNLLKDQRLFKGKHVSIHQFMSETDDKLRVGFAGNSGRKSDLGRQKAIINQLLLSTDSRFHGQIEGVSGMTNLCGVRAFYEALEDLRINSSGIMSEKGLGYKLANAQRMVVWGSDWGNESDVFLRSIDILIALGGGGQTGNEIKAALKRGGRSGKGIPVIAMSDPIVGNWTFDNFRKNRNTSFDPSNPNKIQFFDTSNIQSAANYFNQVLGATLKKRGSVLPS